MPELKNQWTGVNMRGRLMIFAQTPDLLVGRLIDSQRAQVDQEMTSDWWRNISTTNLDYEQLELNVEHFQLRLRNDSVVSISVHQEMNISELNILKGIVSQLSVDLSAINEIRNSKNQLLESDGTQATYRVMEATVNGDCETLYDIVRSPKYLNNIQTYQRPDKVALTNEQMAYEVVKTKNFDNCRELPVYAVSDSVINPKWTDNGIEKSSEARMMLYGSSQDDFTMQSSETVDQIVIRPISMDRDQITVVSKVSLHLESVDQTVLRMPADLLNVGNLVYTAHRTPIPREQLEELVSHRYGEGNEKTQHNRPRRYVASQEDYDDEESTRKISSKFVQNERKLTLSGLDKVQRLLNEMENELRNPTEITKAGTLNKFIISSNIVRFELTKEEILQLYRQLLNEERQTKNRARTIFRDVVADAGSENAVEALIELISSEELRGEEASQVIGAWPRTIRILDEDLQQKIFVCISSFFPFFHLNLNLIFYFLFKCRILQLAILFENRKMLTQPH